MQVNQCANPLKVVWLWSWSPWLSHSSSPEFTILRHTLIVVHRTLWSSSWDISNRFNMSWINNEKGRGCAVRAWSSMKELYKVWDKDYEYSKNNLLSRVSNENRGWHLPLPSSLHNFSLFVCHSTMLRHTAQPAEFGQLQIKPVRPRQEWYFQQPQVLVRNFIVTTTAA